MTRVHLILSIRQLCEGSIRKLDVMVKPDVVIREFELRRRALRLLVESSQCNRAERGELLKVIGSVGSFTRMHKQTPYECRKRLEELMRHLPSAIK